MHVSFTQKIMMFNFFPGQERVIQALSLQCIKMPKLITVIHKNEHQLCYVNLQYKLQLNQVHLAAPFNYKQKLFCRTKPQWNTQSHIYLRQLKRVLLQQVVCWVFPSLLSENSKMCFIKATTSLVQQSHLKTRPYLGSQKMISPCSPHKPRSLSLLS